MAWIFKQSETPILIVVPLVLVLCAIFKIEQSALLSLFVVTLSLIVFFAHYETSKPALRQIMPAVVLGALAAAGRLLFMAFPNFKPVTAIVILSGMIFGKRTGFMVGVLAALISNFFFGQGPWTPWQMYSWGIIGYFSGVLSSYLLSKNPVVIYAYGFLSAIFYGFLLNTWHIIGFVQPLTWQSALLAYSVALPLDLSHAVATVLFLLLLYAPWRKKLERIKQKFELLALR